MEHQAPRQFGPFVFDAQERVLRRDGAPVALTPKGFDLLEAFVEQPGRLLSKDELLRRLWPDIYVEESNLAYHVFGLRKALGDTAENGRYIETVPKRGYRFTAAVSFAHLGPDERPSGVVSAITDSAPLGDESLSTLVGGGLSEWEPASRRPFPANDTLDLAVPLLGGPSIYRNDTGPGRPPARASSRVKRSAIVALVILLGASAAYFVARSWGTAPRTEPMRALPLVSLTGVVRAPSLSPDGKYVVFAWTGEKHDNPDLYVQQIGAGIPLRLTTDPGNDYSPSWSPDGRTIAFLRRAPPGGPSEVRLIAPLGGPEHKVADVQPRLLSYLPLSIAWCPDSSCVLVTDSRGGGHPDAVFAIAVDTGEKRQLTDPKGRGADSDPAVSPDGRFLVFRRNTTPFSGEFYRLAVAEGMVPRGDPVRLTSTLPMGVPRWTPDSRWILFALHGGLWKLDVLERGAPTRLPFVGADGHTPSVSRVADGRQRLVYVRSFSDGNVWRVSTAGPGVAADSPPAAAIVSTRGDIVPSLSPDDRRIAFSSDRSGELQIWIADPDGSKAVQLTSLPPGALPGFARWSPDGRTIAFHSGASGRPDVMVMPTRGGKPRRLTADLANAGFPNFSRDGRWIYFTVVQNGEPRIWKMPAGGGAATRVTNNAGTIAIESLDARDLYYVEATARPSSLWRQRLPGGPPVKLLDGVLFGNFDVVERGIYYLDQVSGEASRFFTDRPPDETRLRYFDFATQRTSTVARNLGWVSFGLSASRNGRTVFFSRIDSSVDELMIVDDFQ